MRLHPQRPSDLHATDRIICFDIETIVDSEPADGSFPPWPQHRPVAAAFLNADWTEDGYAFEFATVTCAPSEETSFYADVDRLLPTGPTSVSYNGSGFDLPVLRLGAMAAQRFEAPGLSAHAQDRRYGDKHADLAELFSGYGGTRRVPLSELCARLGIPVKTAVHGGDVGQLWRAGEVETVKRYVQEDVIATYILWLHWCAFRAGDEKLIAVPLADLVAWIERTPALAHLRHFCTCRPAMWARARALVHRVAYSRQLAETRRRHARDRKRFVPAARF